MITGIHRCKVVCFIIFFLLSPSLSAHTDVPNGDEQGTINLTPELIKAAHIEIATAGTQMIEKKLSVLGKITSNRDTLAPIYPRYSGIIKMMTRQLGDAVTKGELLVTIESNESLQNYSINAPISGTVVQKQMTTGELAKSDKPIYEIANLNTVWADLILYRKEAPLVKKGMSVTVVGDDGFPKSNSIINYISPLGIEDSQTTFARAVLSNETQQWLPGMYVNALIIIQRRTVPIAVPVDAVQRWHDKPVIFLAKGTAFQATPVTLGESDDQCVEIKAGLKSGEHYVAKNSFILKADLEKSGASHEH